MYIQCTRSDFSCYRERSKLHATAATISTCASSLHALGHIRRLYGIRANTLNECKQNEWHNLKRLMYLQMVYITKWTQNCCRSNTLNHNNDYDHFVHYSTLYVDHCDLFVFFFWWNFYNFSKSKKEKKKRNINFGQWLCRPSHLFTNTIHFIFTAVLAEGGNKIKYLWNRRRNCLPQSNPTSTSRQNSNKNQCWNVCTANAHIYLYRFTHHFVVRHRLSQVLFPIEQLIRWP